MDLQQQKTKISEDNMYIIAEELLAKIPDGWRIDFSEQNAYTLFMTHSEISMRTVISQFAKFKRIYLSRYGEKQDISFYKTENKLNFGDSQTEFCGPYNVPKGMLEYIIENGKFRVDTIDTSNFLLDEHRVDIKALGEIDSLKAFCTLFLGKQVEIPEMQNFKLAIKKLKTGESVVSTQNNFEAILALDAVNLEISLRENSIIDCSQYQYKSSVIAPNTTKIIMNCSFAFDSQDMEEDLKFANNVQRFALFVIHSCPNLKEMEFQINSSFDSPIDFTKNAYSTVKSLEENFIKKLNIGNNDLKISFELTGNCFPYIYEELTFQDHELFKIGSAMTIEYLDENAEPYTARSLEINDQRGRLHKLIIKIFQEQELTSEYSDPNSLMSADHDYDDDYPDYDNEEDYDEMDIYDEEDY